MKTSSVGGENKNKIEIESGAKVEMNDVAEQEMNWF